jgi:hypothetical protein
MAASLCAAHRLLGFRVVALPDVPCGNRRAEQGQAAYRRADSVNFVIAQQLVMPPLRVARRGSQSFSRKVIT